MLHSVEKTVLGFIGDEVVDEEDPFATKVGGFPNWLSSEGPQSSLFSGRCKRCNADLALVLQAYAPLSIVPSSHRAVYVFACPTRRCSATADGWTAVRCHRACTAAELAELRPPEAAAAAAAEPPAGTGSLAALSAVLRPLCACGVRGCPVLCADVRVVCADVCVLCEHERSCAPWPRLCAN
eukprot:TRINITY_DN7399_c0_g1_i1.p1 TRINITY_DN7399_c0_g1~~TRINITY_DN7399_c0_g1_i1.p1  ORF type:complete len:182 (-),score=2.56 TRINITY_DN7399_c0_g1_i1:35-580(-)